VTNRPYPKAYTENVPAWLGPVSPLPSEAELTHAEKVRTHFRLEGRPMPYMTDMIRAMRLVKGKKRYIEVGTYDKGCLAYVSTLLHPEALLIDVDIEGHPERTARLKSFMQPGQTLATVTGSSSLPEVVNGAREALGGEPADVIFIDGDHSAPGAWADYANFVDLLIPGGVMLFHDIFWRGTESQFGVSQVMEWIDRVTPVHVVLMDHPIHRFFPHFDRSEELWGAVGIIRP
jgi:predicted O-methyltransferase YrrM